MSARSVLITGCSSGIGLATASALKTRGWRVFASARDAADVETLRDKGFEAVQLDLASSDSIMMALDWVFKRSDNRLDALYNNGAFAIPGAVEDLSRDALAFQFNAGLLGWHELTVRVLPYMRRQGHGRIVNCSSVLGLVAMRYRGAYSAMKYAVEGLSDALRQELHGSGIVVSLIEPGPIKTEFRDNAYAQFDYWIDDHASFHKQAYAKMLARLQSEKPAPFTLAPEAVAEKVVHALEAKRPKQRYYVTRATRIMAFLKWLLPGSALDYFILHLAERENRYYAATDDSSDASS